MIGLENVFAGQVHLTASQRAFVLSAIKEAYARGWGIPRGRNHLEFHRGVVQALSDLKLHLMASPDGTELVSVEEHRRRFSGAADTTP